MSSGPAVHNSSWQPRDKKGRFKKVKSKVNLRKSSGKNEKPSLLRQSAQKVSFKKVSPNLNLRMPLENSDGSSDGVQVLVPPTTDRVKEVIVLGWSDDESEPRLSPPIPNSGNNKISSEAVLKHKAYVDKAKPKKPAQSLDQNNHARGVSVPKCKSPERKGHMDGVLLAVSRNAQGGGKSQIVKPHVCRKKAKPKKAAQYSHPYPQQNRDQLNQDRVAFDAKGKSETRTGHLDGVLQAVSRKFHEAEKNICADIESDAQAERYNKAIIGEGLLWLLDEVSGLISTHFRTISKSPTK